MPYGHAIHLSILLTFSESFCSKEIAWHRDVRNERMQYVVKQWQEESFIFIPHPSPIMRSFTGYYRRLQITICFWVWHCHGWLLHRADALRATYRKYKSSFLNSVDSSWLTSHLRYSHIILYFSLIDFYGQVIVYLKKNWGRWIRIWHSFNSFKSLGDAAAYFFVHSSIKLKTWIQRFSRALSSIVAFFSLKKIHWGR